MTVSYEFKVHIGDKPQIITQQQLDEFADFVGLNRAAKDRFSWLFAFNLYLHDKVDGIDPTMIVGEIKNLESGVGSGTKRATEFRYEPLRGLWHKHFFSSHFIPQNLLNQLAKGKRLQLIAKEVFDPAKSSVVTQEIIDEFVQRVTIDQFEERNIMGNLTGEWIVFAKHDGANYYLCTSKHSKHRSEDQAIYDLIKLVCFPQFPFLAPKL